MAALSLEFLGPVNITYNGQVITDFRTRSVLALLAFLAVEELGSRSHQREALAELLWPGYPPGAARKNLRQTLYELRRLIPDVTTETDQTAPLILGTRETIQINPDCNFELDTAYFTKLIHDGSFEALRRAVELYRGDFLEDFALPDSGEFEIWVSTWRSRFRREALKALNHLATIALHQQDYALAESYAHRTLEIDDWQETAVGHLMQALVGQGQRNTALKVYDEARLRLQEELGIEPDAQLSELWNQIRVANIDTLVEEPSIITAPSTKESGKKTPYNLPTPTTPFIGRRTEVEQVKSLVLNPANHLITLTGPGGSGKTRLSIQVASEVRETFPDGVFFASLAAVQNAEGITPALVKALAFTFYREQEHPRQQLLNYLCDKQLLLILDDFEHLIGNGARGLSGEILSVAPDVKLLVTSRMQLNIQGEYLYPVGGMRTPDPVETATWDHPYEQAKSFSAVQLFLECARRTQPDFTLTTENVISVIEICQLVQGMPLGLELAAAWVRLLPPDEIATQIARSLDFLETDQADVPDRQRSIRAVFESSWTLLSKDEREAFLSLCVFVGSFSREAAQYVSGASLRTLLGLAKKSWLQQTDGGRFQLHELMCQYGEERLKADKLNWLDVKNCHAEYFSRFVANQSRRMQSPEQVLGVKAIAEEFEGNIKIAWDWLLFERRWKDIIENMLLGLFQFGMIRWWPTELIPWFRTARLSLSSEFTTEGRLAFAIFSTLEIYCEESAQVKDADPIARLGLTWQLVNQHNLAEAMGFWFVILAGMVRARNLGPDTENQIETIIDRLREQKSPWLLGISLLFRANWMSDYKVDQVSLLEAAQIFEDMGVIWEQGIVAEQLGLYAYQHRLPLAEVLGYYNQARQVYQKLKGHSLRIGINLWGLWNIYFQQGEYEQAFALFKEEQRELENIGQTRMLENNKHWECIFAARYSSYEHALRLRLQSLESIRKQGSQSDLAWQLFELGEIYRIFGEPEKALELYEQVHPKIEKMNMTLALGFYQRAQGDLSLQDERYSDALAYYQKFNAYAREDNSLWGMAQSSARIALAHAYLGNIEQARPEMQSTLTEMYNYRQDDLALQTLLVEAVCLIQEGNYEAAIELVSFLQSHPGSWNETKLHAREILETASCNLHQEVVQAAIERGKAMNFDLVMAKLITFDKKG